MLTKPKKPWKNLEQARKEVSIWRPATKKDFPCLACGGRGSYRDIKDLCPIEGYKLAPSYRCRLCDGSCIGFKAAFVEYYKKKINDYKWELTIYQHKIGRFQELKKQLSKADMDILKECLR